VTTFLQTLETFFWNVLNRPGLSDIADILIVAIIIYELLMLTRDTRGSAVLKGLAMLLLIVGMFLEGGAALIILAPLMVPIVKAAGIDLVHFGIVCNVNIMIGGLTPPFGSMMFTCVSITGCKMQEFIKECVPFIIALLIALLLLTYIPGISMLIPNLIY